MATEKVKHNIAGTEYNIRTDEDPVYIAALGNEINNKITRLMEDNDSLSVVMAATLVALDYCDMYVKAEDCADNLRKQIKEYLEENSHSRTQTDNARREIERLKKENAELKELLNSIK